MSGMVSLSVDTPGTHLQGQQGHPIVTFCFKGEKGAIYPSGIYFLILTLNPIATLKK